MCMIILMKELHLSSLFAFQFHIMAMNLELIFCVFVPQVPELFYLPETLTNENSIDFGTTQLGGKLGMFLKVLRFSIMDKY